MTRPSPCGGESSLVGEEAQVQVELVLCTPTELIVVQPPDRSRRGIAFSGRVEVRDASGQVVLSRRLRHWYRGRYLERLSFALPLPPGEHQVQVRDAREATGEAVVVVAEGARSAVEVQLQGPAGPR